MAVQVPDYTVIFTQLVIIEALMDSLSGPMITGLMATGKIKFYQIVVGSLLIIPLGISILLLKQGFGATTVLWVSIFFTCISIGVRTWFGKLLFSFPIKPFLRLVILRIIYVTIPAGIITYIVTLSNQSPWLLFISTGLCSSISILLFIYLVGLEKEERLLVISLVKKIITKIKH